MLAVVHASFTSARASPRGGRAHLGVPRATLSLAGARWSSSRALLREGPSFDRWVLNNRACEPSRTRRVVGAASAGVRSRSFDGSACGGLSGRRAAAFTFVRAPRGGRGRAARAVSSEPSADDETERASEETGTDATQDDAPPPSALASGWFKQILAGLTVSLAMVPESLAFTFVAGVPPLVGLHAASLMALVCAACGAQPGIISGAAGATAVVFAPLVASHGLEYLFAAVLLAGVFQVAAGVLRLGKFIRLVPQPVMLGFVNGLAIVIGSAQLAQFKAASGAWLTGAPMGTMLALTALTMGIIKVLPKLTTAVPAPLMAILTTTGLTHALGLQTRTVGDLATVAGTLPSFHLPGVPLDVSTLAVVAPVAASVAAVGLIETLLTQQLVDDITGKRTATHKECIGQGLGNIVNGMLGGMGGCAMIGQSMINVNAGGRTRLAGLTCAAALMAYVLVGSSFIEKVPLAALTGTMFMLVVDIFDWTSFKRLTKIPKTDAAVLCLVTGVTVVTNLAVAVLAGVILASLGFAWKSAQRIEANRTVEPKAYAGKPAAVYKLRGPLFFGSVTSFRDCVDPKTEAEEDIVLDFMESKVWDSSALDAIDSLVAKCVEEGKRMHLRHLSPDCRVLLAKAGDLVEVNVMEDPAYALAADNEAPEKVEVVKPALVPMLRGTATEKTSGDYVVYSF